MKLNILTICGSSLAVSSLFPLPIYLWSPYIFPFLHCLWDNLKKGVFEIFLREILDQLLFFQGLPQFTFRKAFRNELPLFLI